MSERIAQILKMSLASMERLDGLVDPKRKDTAATELPVRTALVMIDPDDVRQVSRHQLAAAIDGLAGLQEALNTWAAQTLDGGRA